MPNRIIALLNGKVFQIELAQTEDGECPAKQFLDNLSDQLRAKILNIINKFANAGVIHNREQFKKVEDDFFEFKHFQTRMPFYLKPGSRVVITHGFIKKKDKTIMPLTLKR